ncbi:mucin-5AC [Lingula anatina]|uniref:Mucin-5AC n=1 Tax=Lingula anatina TaxID=7574 RepID=A0A1S3JGR6_LINAN|nr:mucin-5AC [Lingula anatina]|eukprot:XP_013409600.1 mucin-5AC [Lingula anatina]
MRTKELKQFSRITFLMKNTVLLVIWLEMLWVRKVSSFETPAAGSGTLSVKLIQFENENGLKYDKTKCDTSFFPQPCLHAFIIKITIPSGCSGLVCSRTVESKEYTGNIVLFGQYLDDGKKEQNPFQVSFTNWPGEFSLEVTVYHKKASLGDKDNLVDKYIESDVKLNARNTTHVTLIGKTIKTSLNVQFNVSCSPGLYGPRCMCKPISSLHICTDNGKLSCRKGYVKSGNNCVPITTSLETTTTTGAETRTTQSETIRTKTEPTFVTDTPNLYTRATTTGTTEIPYLLSTLGIKMDSTTKQEPSAGTETTTIHTKEESTKDTTSANVVFVSSAGTLHNHKIFSSYPTLKDTDKKFTVNTEHVTLKSETSQPTSSSALSYTTEEMARTPTANNATLISEFKTTTAALELITSRTTDENSISKTTAAELKTTFPPTNLFTLSQARSTVLQESTLRSQMGNEANFTSVPTSDPPTTETLTITLAPTMSFKISSKFVEQTTMSQKLVTLQSSRTTQSVSVSRSTESTTAAANELSTRLQLGNEENYSTAQTSDAPITVTLPTVMSASVTREATEKSMKPTTTSEELVTVPVISTQARYFPSSTQLRLATTAWSKLSTKAPRMSLHTAAVSTAKQAFTFSYYRPTKDRMNSRLSTYLRTISPKSLQSTTTNTKAHTTRGRNKKYSSGTMNSKAQEVTAVYNTASTTQTTNEPTKTEQPHSPDSTVDLHFKVSKRNPPSATTKKEQGRSSMKPAEVTMSTTVQVNGATDGHESNSPVISFLSRFRTPLASVGFLLVFAVVIVIVAVKWNCSKRSKKCDSKVEHYSESTYSSESLRSAQRPTIGPNVAAHLDRNCLLWQDMSKTNNLGPIELPRIKLNTLRDYSKEKRNGRNCRYKDSTI